MPEAPYEYWPTGEAGQERCHSRATFLQIGYELQITGWYRHMWTEHPEPDQPNLADFNRSTAQRDSTLR